MCPSDLPTLLILTLRAIFYININYSQLECDVVPSTFFRV